MDVEEDGSGEAVARTLRRMWWRSCGAGVEEDVCGEAVVRTLERMRVETQ